MKKYLLAFTLFFLTGCNVYIVEVNKTICIHGEHSTAEMTGSDLKDISSDPTNDVKTKAKLPVVP